MAEIRQYRREKKENTSEVSTKETAQDYETRLRVHRQRMIAIAIVSAIVIIIVIFVLCLVKHKSSYSDYTVESTIRRNDSGYAQYFALSDEFIRCSRDGVAAYSYSGTQIWNRTFEISNRGIDFCGDYFAIGNLGGNEIFIFNKNGYVSSVNTSLPITSLCVSEQGLVVAVVEDTSADYINMYDKEGNKIYTIKTTVTSDGVPVAVTVSPDGKKLAVAFTSVTGLELSTSVVFYNFDEVGQNENERIVGGFDTYGDQIVPEIRFINSNTVLAFGENVISFYSVNEYPKLTKDVTVDYKIEKNFYSENYAGIVYTDTDNDGKTMLSVYDTSGERILNQEVDSKYTSYSFSESGILMYNDEECCLLNMKGKNIFSHSMEEEICALIPIGEKAEFLYVSTDKIYKIKLK